MCAWSFIYPWNKMWCSHRIICQPALAALSSAPSCCDRLWQKKKNTCQKNSDTRQEIRSSFVYAWQPGWHWIFYGSTDTQLWKRVWDSTFFSTSSLVGTVVWVVFRTDAENFTCRFTSAIRCGKTCREKMFWKKMVCWCTCSNYGNKRSNERFPFLLHSRSAADNLRY